ncbi:globin [Frondihabitans sucicola]|uniref:Globin n=1 Tax=Frondihabitans sucicola TaxID=1268041 RepID=A0ABM8GNE6_9MICO|nr:globin [Frondihabitans sucicola]BDZ49970.1 globin [Frondihabitans sucicola]
MTDSPTPDPAPAPAGNLQPITVRRGLGDDAAQGNFWEQVGGRETFERLVRRFYEGVRADPVLWPMYPSDDLEGAIQRLTGFLEQYWGGPGTYSEQRGHPRLRMRHLPFAVTPDARDRWLGHMRTAVDSLELSPLDDATLWGYLDRAAHAMVNTFGT